jgi:hypothetical protein
MFGYRLRSPFQASQLPALKAKLGTVLIVFGDYPLAIIE